MTDIPKCPNCEAAEKRAIAVVVCVSALGPEFLDECKNPQWQDAMAIVKKLKAERNALRDLLAEINDILSLCDQGRAGRVHDHMDMQAAACGERDGYGAWMDALQRMWQARDPIGCFTIGPCLGTVRHARKRIASLLASNPKDRRPAHQTPKLEAPPVSGSGASKLLDSEP